MKSNLLVITVMALLLLSSFSSAQSGQVNEVHIGEKVPDINIGGFYQDNASKVVKLSSLYKNKLLILDFWATWCVPCIRELSELDSLKKEFGAKVEIVGVGYESNKIISDFFIKQPELKPKFYSIITNDQVLSRQMFPHRTVPHVVWIDSMGKVLSITEGEAVNKQNISKYLNNNKPILHAKIDIMNFNMWEPFHLRDTNYSGRSIFTNHTDGIASVTAVIHQKSKVPHMIERILVTNQYISQLYWTAAFWGKLCLANYGRMVFEVADSLKYMPASKAESTYKKSKYQLMDKNALERENTYCYELESPEPKPDTVLFKEMLYDLNRNLNLNGRFETRYANCLILKYNKSAKNHLEKSSAEPNISLVRGTEQYLQGQSIKKLIDVINRLILNGQVVDETHVNPKERFNFNITGFKTGINSDQINSILEKYGLYLIEGKRKVSVLVISEK